MKTRTAALLMVAGLFTTSGTVVANAVPAQPTAHSDSGITVTGQRKVAGLERTWQLDISTKELSTFALLGEKDTLQVQVTLPKGYGDAANAQKRYPVQYLLHGQKGDSRDWDFKAADPKNPSAPRAVEPSMEKLTANQNLILVAPDAGSASWYSNWVHQDPRGVQNVENYMIKQLVPFIDHNYRTIASKSGRAIAGFSMGGYGAVYFAGRYPNMFAHVSSFSGGLDLEDQAVRLAVVGSVGLDMMPVDGPFGVVVFPFDTVWKQRNPLRMRENYRNVKVSLYGGTGGDLRPERAIGSVIEVGATHSTHNFDNALSQIGIKAHTNYYGSPLYLNGFECRGGHNYGCVFGAYVEDLPLVMADLQHA